MCFVLFCFNWTLGPQNGRNHDLSSRYAVTIGLCVAASVFVYNIMVTSGPPNTWSLGLIIWISSSSIPGYPRTITLIFMLMILFSRFFIYVWIVSFLCLRIFLKNISYYILSSGTYFFTQHYVARINLWSVQLYTTFLGFLRPIIASVVEPHPLKFIPGALQIKLTTITWTGGKVYYQHILRSSRERSWRHKERLDPKI